MMKKMITLVLLMSFSWAAVAWGVLLNKEVKGFYGYCHYSDGGISTVNSTANCPTNNQKNGSTFVQLVINKTETSVGALKSQSVNGFSRYCTYQNGAIITIKTSEICPALSK